MGNKERRRKHVRQTTKPVRRRVIRVDKSGVQHSMVRAKKEETPT